MRKEGKAATKGLHLLTGKLLALLVAVATALGLVAGLAGTAKAADGDATYVLTDELVDGGEYIITNNAEVGADSTRALKNPGGSSSGNTISSGNGKTPIKIQEGDCIDASSDENIDWTALVWTAVANGDGFNLINKDADYLEGYTSSNSGSSSLRVFSPQKNETGYWTYSDNQLQHHGTSTYTMRYTSGSFGVTTSSSTEKVYLFKKVTEQVDLKGITLEPTTLDMMDGDTEKLTVTFDPANATNKKLTWSSDNEAVATVDKGSVTAVAPGTATITVTSDDGDYTKTCAVTVTEAPSVTYKLSDTMEPSKQYLIAIASGENWYVLSNEETTVSSSQGSVGLKGYQVAVNDSKVTIKQNVAAKTLFTAEGNDENTLRLKLGEEYLYTANSGGLRMEPSTVWTQTSGGGTSNSGKYWHYMAYDGETEKRLLWFYNGTDGSYGYTATDSQKYYLTIDGGIFVRGTVSSSSTVSGSTSIPKIYLFVEDDGTTPEPKTLDSISLSGQTTELNVGGTFTTGDLVVTAKYTDNSTAVIAASGYTVDSSAVKMDTPGTYQVKVSYTEGGVSKEATYDVTVSELSTYKLATSIRKNGEYLIVNTKTAGTAYALKNPGATGTNIANADYKTQVTIDGDVIKTSDADIAWTATPNKDGYNLSNGGLFLQGGSNNVSVVSSLSNADRYWSYSDANQLQYFGGSSTYTIRYSGSNNYFQGTTQSNSSYTVFLFEKEGTGEDTPVEGITLDKDSLTLVTGETSQLKATVSPETATDKTVTWTSSKPEVASVDKNGNVTALTEGETTITATAGSKTATCTVKVNTAKDVTYKLTETLEADKQYLIANGNDGSVYIISNEANGSKKLKGVSAAVSGGKITIKENVEAKTAFTVETKTSDSGSDSYWLKNGSSYLYTDSSNGLRLSTDQTSSSNSGKFWHYKADKNLLWFFKDTSSSDGYDDDSSTYRYYLKFEDGDFTDAHVGSNEKLSTTETPAIYLFVKDDGTSDVPVTGVTVDPTSLELKEGKTGTLTATVAPDNATNKKVTWTSSDESVASVDSKGIVTAKKAGTATITVTTVDGSKTATCAVTVKEDADAATYKLVEQITAGGEYLIVNTDAAGSAYALKNPGGTSGGAAIANTANKVEVTILSGDPTTIKTSDTSIVWKATANGEGFNLTNNGTDYLEGASGNVSVFNPQKYEDRYWTYNESNQLQHKGGQSTYTLRYSTSNNYFQGSTSASSSYTVYLYEREGSAVTVPVTGVTLNPTTLELKEGQTGSLTATVEPENATNKKVTWTSSNEAAATVDSKGVVTAVAPGTATITVTTADGSKTATCAVTVKEDTDAATYKLVDKIVTGGEYLIVNADAAGSASALKNAGTASTIASSSYVGSVTVQSGTPNFIKTSNTSLVWKATANSDGLIKLTNGEAYLEGKSGNVGVFDAVQYADRGWDYADSKLTFTGSETSTVYTLYYSGSSFTGSPSNSGTVYLYAKEGSVVNVPVTGVSLDQATLELKEGQTGSLTATVEPENASNKAVTWTSSDESVATVDSKGVVTAVAPGTATITVTTADGSFTKTCDVTVAAAANVTYKLAETLEADKQYLIANGNDGSVYLVSNEANGSAKLKGVSATVTDGKVTIKESVEAKTAFTAEGKTSDSGAASFWLKNGSSYLYTDSSNGLRMSTDQTTSSNSGKFWHYKAEDKHLLWFFKDTSSSDGYTDTSSTYKYYLTVNGSDYTDAHVSTTSLADTTTPAVYLFVKDEGGPTTIPVTGVTLGKDELALEVDGTEKLTYEITPSDATDTTVTWSSSDSNVATVAADGTVTAKAAGAAIITVTTTDGSFTDTCTVTVSEPVVPATGVSLDQESLDLTVGDQPVQLKATVTPEGSTDTVTWTSSNPEVATVDENGKVTAVAAGEATITATAGDFSATCTVTVAEPVTPDVPVAGVTVAPTDLELIVGEESQLTATVAPADATNKVVTWVSSDTKVAAVDADGKVTAKKAGTAVITVTTVDGGKTATCTITVEDKWKRLSGDTRYATMAEIVKEGADSFANPTVAVLAYGDSYADSLAASSLAGALGCPVVLTDKSRLSREASDMLTMNKVTKVYIVGGENTITPAVKSAVEGMGIATERVYGESREMTSVAVMKKVAELGSFDGTVIVAYGYNFPDALAIGAWAYKTGTPILLTNKATSKTDKSGSLTKAQLAELANYNVTRAIIVGGEKSVNVKVITQLQLPVANENAWTRLSGANRYETAREIATWEIEQGMTIEHVAVATGQNYPDALAGAALCGANNSVLVLAKDDAYNALTVINKAGVKQGYVLGGPNSVSEDLFNYLVNLTK